LGTAAAPRLQAQAPAAAGTRPSLAILPLKEDGRKDLGDLSGTMNMCVATAFAECGAFRLVDQGQVAAALPALKLQGAESLDARAIADLGQRLGAKYLVMGSFLPESNLAKGTVTITVSPRMVDTGEGTVARHFQEFG